MSFLPSSSCYHFSPSGYQTAAGIAFVMNRPGKRKADDPASPVHGSSPASPASPVTNSLMPTASPFSFGNAANSFAAPAGGHPTSAAAHQPREFKRRAIRAQDPVVPFMPPQQVPPAPMDVCDDQGQDSLNAMAVEGADVDADGSVGGSGAGGASWVPVTPAWAIPLTGWSQYSSPSLELAQARVPAHQRLPSDSMDMS